MTKTEKTETTGKTAKSTTYHSNNGRMLGVFLTNELLAAIESLATREATSRSRIIREALIPYLESKGFAFSEKANPDGVVWKKAAEPVLAD